LDFFNLLDQKYFEWADRFSNKVIIFEGSNYWNITIIQTSTNVNIYTKIDLKKSSSKIIELVFLDSTFTFYIKTTGRKLTY